MRTFVAGATGFVGSARVVDFRLEKGAPGLTRSQACADKLSAQGAELLHGTWRGLERPAQGRVRCRRRHPKPVKVRPKDHMGLLLQTLPSRYSPLQASGNGNQRVFLTAVPPLMAQALLGLIGAEATHLAADTATVAGFRRFVSLLASRGANKSSKDADCGSGYLGPLM